MNIEKLLKKAVYTGVGFVSLTTEKMKSSIETLVNDEKISAEEGKKIIEDFMQNADDKKSELENQFKTVKDKIKGSVGFAKQKDLENLENRIKVLESLVSKKKKKNKSSKNKK